ncbi:5-oxoprolinase subunit C family protein [Alienimonas californiensis]|uniref:KipI antagonist n=1 Tax=Alienimonas californiensis TaxID=2527989 RepID=A0A517PB80_9PLAN|nr:biotin-dependent carboxyltransferase family protein [Alienimonas californiensis]QDT16620.1 KipI antagonist [Alienimonas californiensis]
MPTNATIDTSGEAVGRLSVVRAGMLSLLQDRGRRGLAFYAIPPSGPLDRRSAELGNAILGNDPDAPVIECHFVPPALRFESAAVVCLTGADMGWTVGGRPAPRYATVAVAAGQTLAGRPAVGGCRAYVGVQGSIRTSRSFGSASTYVPGRFGGNGGRPLAAGDVIRWQRPEETRPQMSLSLADEDASDRPITLRPGPEYDRLTPTAQHQLTNGQFWVSPNSDRMGARLEGPTLTLRETAMTDSVPVLPGMIQAPPSGRPIVLLQDGQTTGGYPRVGYLPAAEVDRLVQIPPRRPFRFRFSA